MSTLGLIFCLLGSVFTKRRHFRPDPFLSCAERWQDSRAVRDSRGPCSERRPLPGRIFARCVPERRFAGLFGCMARISCRSQPVFGCMARESCRELAIFPSEAAFGMHGAQNLPRIDARERTAAESCHGKTPGNAPRENIATASRAKSASGRNPATARCWGGRTARAFCHRRAPGNAPWRNLVTTSRLRTHFAHILPSPGAWECIASIPCHWQTSENAQRRHTATASRPVAQRSPREGVGSGPWLRCGVRRATLSVRGSGHSAFSGLNCWERFRVCAVSVGNHELASRSAKLCRIMC